MPLNSPVFFPHSPPGFIITEECRKAAWQNGYRRPVDSPSDGWLAYGSTTAKGTLFLAAASDSGPWGMALDHLGVIAECGLAAVDVPGPGSARYVFSSLRELYAILPRIYALAASLPDGPLSAFLDQTHNLPRTTETERLVIQRIGQNIFRNRLIDYWGARCPLTGVSEPELLRASHIKPWAACETDAERLDVHNGLLLSPLWDAAFDSGLVTFEDDGTPRFASSLTKTTRNALRWTGPLSLTQAHLPQMNWHRHHIFRT